MDTKGRTFWPGLRRAGESNIFIAINPQQGIVNYNGFGKYATANTDYKSPYPLTTAGKDYFNDITFTFDCKTMTGQIW